MLPVWTNSAAALLPVPKVPSRELPQPGLGKMTSCCSPGPHEACRLQTPPHWGEQKKYLRAQGWMLKACSIYPRKSRIQASPGAIFLMSSMTLSVDKGMGSGRVTHSHSWGAPHTDSLHLQVASKPSPTSARPPLLRTVRPSSLHHSHLTQDPGTRQYSCPPTPPLCSLTPHTSLHCLEFFYIPSSLPVQFLVDIPNSAQISPSPGSLPQPGSG